MDQHIDINDVGTSNQDLATQRIDKKLAELPTSELSHEFVITKVHEGLRNVQPKAYEPMLISIGPYHYQNQTLQAMEKQKLRFLRSFLKRRGEKSVERYRSALVELEPKVREHYIDLPKCLETPDKFVEMMLLDGCFIIEYFQRIYFWEIEPDDYFIIVPWMRSRICLDFILLENQLPYFVLTRLYEEGAAGLDFKHRAIQDFKDNLQKQNSNGAFKDKKVFRQAVKNELLPLESSSEAFKMLQSFTDQEFLPQPEAAEAFIDIAVEAFKEVLRKLEAKGEFRYLAIQAFNKVLPNPQPMSKYGGGGNGNEEIKHLLHLVHISFCASKKQGPKNENPTETRKSVSTPTPNEVSDKESPLLVNNTHGNNDSAGNHDNADNDNNAKEKKDGDDVDKLRPLVKLREAGVKLKEGGNENSKKASNNDKSSTSTTSTLFAIKFKKGLLEIPCFTVEDSTETLFRNLIAYEQHSYPLEDQYFTDFVTVMDKLIDSEADVKLLRDKGIIVNCLGDDKAVSELFNKLGDGVVIYPSSFTYDELCSDLNNHCKTPWNTMLAKFWGDYFNTPWAGVSSIVALVILVLTTTVTVKSLLS